MDRRSWLQLIGVLSAARAGYGQQAPAPPPQKVTREQVTAALQLLGLQFSDAEITTMLPGVNRALAGFEALRKVDVPLDTEPAFSFHPGLAGRKSAAGAARFRPTVKKAPAAGGLANLREEYRRYFSNDIIEDQIAVAYELAEKYRTTPSAILLAYITSHDISAVALAGFSNLAQAKDTLDNTDITLTPEELSRLGWMERQSVR
jgi:hypothetical protein